GKSMELTIERSGSAEPIKVKVTTATTIVDPVELKPVNDHVAYLRVTQFTDAATETINKLLTDLPQKALIVDLRDNAGGPVTAAQPLPGSAAALLSRLTGGGDLGSVVRKSNRPEPIHVDKSAGTRYRLAVLVNHGTANVAEVVASALKKSGATLIGAPTFGDSTMQRLVSLKDGAAMTLSAGKYLTSTGQEFTGK